MVIAIDGPAGAGKSSVARAVAERLDYLYLDTGAMYRCIGLLVAEGGGEPARVAAQAKIKLGERVMLDGRDVTDAIRTPGAAEYASRVAADQGVRAVLVKKQREMLRDGRGWVAEGRDIGTHVYPGAEVKVFLTASPEVRASRRAAELGLDPVAVLAELSARDERDVGREHSPLVAAADAVAIDTTELHPDAVVDRIIRLVVEVMELGL